jgi:ABC-2 type transport system ATP-binding protein
MENLMNAIETQNLVHAYQKHFWSPRKTALNGLDLKVAEGEIFGYLGANGAGKTTTIKILVGLHSQTSGTATVFGRSVRDVNSRREIGFMPENPYFYEYLTAAESLDFYGSLCDMPRADRKKRGAELLEFVGLADARDVRMKEFSKGMRQRIGIAQALIHKPKLVVLDEPMSGLDPVGRMQVREAILSLKREGMTVFFSSHVLQDVEMICDRAGLLLDGKLQAAGPLSELLQAENKRIEVAAENLPPQLALKLHAVAASSARRGEGEFFIFDDRDKADAAAREIVQSGAKLNLFRPSGETLEEYFMRSTGKTRAEVGAWSGGGDK